MADFIRKMVIQRVRKKDDESNFVDQAITIEETTQTGSGPTFQRVTTKYSTHLLYLGSEQSAPFEVTSKADLQAALDSFVAQFPD